MKEIDEDTDISEEYFTTNFDQVIHRHFLPKGEYLEGPIKNEYIFFCNGIVNISSIILHADCRYNLA